MFNRCRRVLAFLDFEASSLSADSYPIEVAWVFEDGGSEAHLIRPAPEWDDWDSAAEAIHQIPRADLLMSGTSHELVARRMVDVLQGHDLCASAPSWDGKWLSALLRAAGFHRRSLRLRDSDDVIREAARAILTAFIPAAEAEVRASEIIATCQMTHRTHPPRHRALADAHEEWRLWLDVKHSAEAWRRADKLREERPGA